jgi:hypothetical protein
LTTVQWAKAAAAAAVERWCSRLHRIVAVVLTSRQGSQATLLVVVTLMLLTSWQHPDQCLQ